MENGIVHHKNARRFQSDSFPQLTKEVTKSAYRRSVSIELMLLNSMLWRNGQDDSYVFSSLPIDCSHRPLSYKCTTSSPLRPNIEARLIDVDDKRRELSSLQEPGGVESAFDLHVRSVSVK